MIIKWIFEDLEPGQIRGPAATSEDGNYQIVFEFYALHIFYYLYENSECIYAYKIDTDTKYPFEFSDLLAECHRVIERRQARRKEAEYYHLDRLQDPECTVKLKDNVRTCGNCNHLIFKDYRHGDGTCCITHRFKSFYDRCDRCDHEEEMS